MGMATNWTLTQVLNQLNSGSLWSSNTITYSFPTTSTNMYTGSGEGAGFSALSNLQITIAEYALTGWDDLIAATFVEGSGKTNIEIANTTTGIDYAHAYYPTTGSVWFNSGYDDVANPVVGDYGFGTFIHELGHALGLDHMGDYNGNGTWAPSSYQDSTVLSIMSYFGPDHHDGEGTVMWADWVKGGTTYSAQTPMLNDVMAIQAMYGADTTTRTGGTVYGFNSNITGNAGKIFDFDVNGNPIVCIYDASGNDTIDLSGFSTKSSISLVAGTFSDCNEMTNNISIAYTATIENAVGGSGNDTITGNDVANILTGGRGNDTINGGNGDDVAVFSGAYTNYTVVSNGNGSYTVTDNVGNDGNDTLSSIETLRFSDKDVTDGGTDSDTAPVLSVALADQSADPDSVFIFTIPAGSFTDPNGDALTYSAKLSGGGSLPSWLSFDPTTATFSGTPDAGDAGTLSIVVTASDGSEGVTDTFEISVGDDDGGGSIILGTKKNNTLYGADAAETLRALGGKDKIFAGDGGDTIEGGAGRDLLWGEAGADIFKFGNKNGMDDIKDFSLADGDRIDLSGVSAISSYTDLIDNHFFSYKGDAYIKVSAGNDILVVGIDAADLMSEGNFIF
jgi:serralysin